MVRVELGPTPVPRRRPGLILLNDLLDEGRITTTALYAVGILYALVIPSYAVRWMLGRKAWRFGIRRDP